MNNAEVLVETFLALRGEREKLKANYEAADESLKADMEKIEAALLDMCNTANVSGLRTSHGTVTKQVKERFFCTDWDHFKQFVENEGSLDLLERRIHQRNFKEFMAGRDKEGLPPGVNALREFDIVVRKAPSRSEATV